MKTLFKLFFALTTIVLQTAVAKAQAPEIDWAKAYGGSVNDYCSKIQQTPDGGYLIAGRTFSSNFDVSNNYGPSDGWVIKTDAFGTIEWEKNYGGSNTDGIVDFVVLDNAAGYVFLAHSVSDDIDLSPASHNNVKIWIFQTDLSGNIVNSVESHTSAGNRNPIALLQDTDGDFVFMYTHLGDIWMAKINAELYNIIWQKSYGGNLFDTVSKIKKTNDGGYIFIGYTESSDGDVGGNYGSYDIWVVKTNQFGTIEWEKNYGGSSWDYGMDIVQNPDGGYTFVANTASNDFDVDNNYGEQDIWVVKINESGEIQWEQNYGGSNNDQATSIIELPSGGFAVSGLTVSNDGDISGHIGGADFWVFELGGQGELIWHKPMGGTGEELSLSSLYNANNQIVLAGQTNSNNVDVTGNHGGTDIWVTVLESTLGVSETTLSEISLYPNPVTDKLFIQTGNLQLEDIQLFSFSGQFVNSITYTQNLENLYITDMSHLAPGVYFLRITTENKARTFKIIKN